VERIGPLLPNGATLSDMVHRLRQPPASGPQDGVASTADDSLLGPWSQAQGTYLPPGGQWLAEHGETIAPARESCGAAILATHLTPAQAVALLQEDRDGREPSRPWISPVLRRPCCVPQVTAGGRPVPRLVRSDGAPGPDFAQMALVRGRRWESGDGVGLSADTLRLSHDKPGEGPTLSGGGRPGVGGTVDAPCPPRSLGSPSDLVVSFGPNGIADQAKREWISLGPDPYGVPMRATVPADFKALYAKEMMLEAYIPDWLDRCAPSGGSDFSMAKRCIHYTSDRNLGDVPGLVPRSEAETPVIKECHRKTRAHDPYR